MEEKQKVVDSVVMVQQMAGAPEEVVAVLDRAEQEKLLADLPSLIEQADRVQKTGDGLLDLAKHVHRLVEGIPALAELFPTIQVGVRLSANQEVSDSRFFVGKQAQEQAAMIYNAVVELDQRVNEWTQELGQRSNDDHGQTSPTN